MRKVIIESPFKGEDWSETKKNIYYARLCMRDSILRGEAPLASHLLYTQTGILDDRIKEERRRGIEGGFVWGEEADVSAFYIDLGFSKGMEYGLIDAKEKGREIEYRRLGSLSNVLCMITELSKKTQLLNPDILF